MARDTDRLLQSLTGVDENSMRYAQMQAQREAQDQATGSGLHEMAARRTDQLGQQAAQMGMHEQARGDSLAGQAADLEMRKAHQAEVLAQRVAEMQELSKDREDNRDFQREQTASRDTQHKETLASNRALRMAEIGARKELKQTPPAPRPDGEGRRTIEQEAALEDYKNSLKMVRDAYNASPEIIPQKQEQRDQQKEAALNTYRVQFKSLYGREPTRDDLSKAVGTAAATQQAPGQQTPPATGGTPGNWRKLAPPNTAP